MTKTTETIGHWNRNAVTCSNDSVLNEVRRDDFGKLLEKEIKSIPECPYNKEDAYSYKNWKSSNLPILFFTLTNRRPDRDNAAMTSSYAMIDIDCDNTRYVSDHPAVCFTNYTGSGTHIFIHSYALGRAKTPKQWQDAYNSIVYEVWSDLCGKYGKDLKMDGHSAMHHWGCYLWNTEWTRNKNLDMEWLPEERYFDSDILEKMYKSGTYSVMTENTTGYGRKKKQIQDNSEIIKKLSGHMFSDEVYKDFKGSHSVGEFVEKYSKKYTIKTGSTPVFTPYTDYLGNTYDMYETKGEMVRLWQPYLVKKSKLIDGKHKIGEGSRHSSLYNHMMQLCIFMHDSIDPDYILYDACHWVSRYFENPKSFGKTEIMSVVTSVIKTYDLYADEWTMWHDKRMFVSGDVRLDKDTGECVKMDKGMKIGANAKCRKTGRIVELIKIWNPDKEIDFNLRYARDYCDDLENKSDKTLKDYIECAKQMPELVKDYPWLKDIEIEKKQKGRQKQPVVIENTETGERFEFKSKKECMEYLGIRSKATFTAFMNGKSKFNKKFKIEPK